MRVDGPRIKKTRLIQTENFVVAVEVEMLFPIDDPSEPRYEPDTVRLLHEIERHAELGDVEWLTKRGKVYAALKPA